MRTRPRTTPVLDLLLELPNAMLGLRRFEAPYLGDAHEEVQTHDGVVEDHEYDWYEDGAEVGNCAYKALHWLTHYCNFLG